jgi:hypothetical protein
MQLLIITRVEKKHTNDIKPTKLPIALLNGCKNLLRIVISSNTPTAIEAG